MTFLDKATLFCPFRQRNGKGEWHHDIAVLHHVFTIVRWFSDIWTICSKIVVSIIDLDFHSLEQAYVMPVIFCKNLCFTLFYDISHRIQVLKFLHLICLGLSQLFISYSSLPIDIKDLHEGRGLIAQHKEWLLDHC